VKRQKAKRQKGSYTRIGAVCVLLFALGLGILLYPTVSSRWNKWRQEQLIAEYASSVSEMEAEGVSLADEWEKAEAYNRSLFPSILPDSFAIAQAQGEPDETYMACLNLSGDGVMGYVSIPKINIKLPIYHTTAEEMLQKGVGHLEGSSLPVGGEGTHAVLAAHRGMPNAEMFTNLDQLEIGDHFLLYILDNVLCYEVDQIIVVEPADTEALSVEEGEDLVTLLTCTPYGVNTQRLLVRGHRVEYEEETVQAETGTANLITHTSYSLWAVGGMIVTAALIVVRRLVIKKRGGPQNER